MIQPWNKRPTEVAHLLNPAFSALLLRESVRGFTSLNSSGMPFPIVFLVLPLTLHRSTRAALPNSIGTKMHPWIEEHQHVQVGFVKRCTAIVEHTREGLLYGIGADLITFTENAHIRPTRTRLKRVDWPVDSEPAACREAANFLGRWLSRAGDTATIFAMWGVRP